MKPNSAGIQVKHIWYSHTDLFCVGRPSYYRTRKKTVVVPFFPQNGWSLQLTVWSILNLHSCGWGWVCIILSSYYWAAIVVAASHPDKPEWKKKSAGFGSVKLSLRSVRLGTPYLLKLLRNQGAAWPDLTANFSRWTQNKLPWENWARKRSCQDNHSWRIRVWTSQ